jgi:hypothetical protein
VGRGCLLCSAEVSNTAIRDGLAVSGGAQHGAGQHGGALVPLMCAGTAHKSQLVLCAWFLVALRAIWPVHTIAQ